MISHTFLPCFTNFYMSYADRMKGAQDFSVFDPDLSHGNFWELTAQTDTLEAAASCKAERYTTRS